MTTDFLKERVAYLVFIEQEKFIFGNAEYSHASKVKCN